MLVGLFNLFFRSPVLHSFSLYVGLLVYCGYVLFDTQKILFKVELGDRNYVEHALHLLTGKLLFTNFTIKAFLTFS